MGHAVASMRRERFADGGWSRLLAAMQVISVRNWGAILVLTIAAVIMLLPLLWMFAASMKPEGAAYALPPSFLPDRLDFASYAKVGGSPIPYYTAYLNSLIVASLTTLGVIVTSTTAAYAFSRLDFRGRDLLFAFMVAGLMVPPALVLIPIYFGLAKISLLDTLWALILPATVSPLGVFMLRQFMAGQPRELEEAAFVDGAGHWSIFWNVSLPQMGPPIAALAIITFTSSWNAFLPPMVLIRSLNKMTLPIAVFSMQAQFGALSLSILMAAVTMAVLPLLLVFLIGQRFIIEGITGTGLKG